MKKAISFLLCIVLIFSFGILASAEEKYDLTFDTVDTIDQSEIVDGEYRMIALTWSDSPAPAINNDAAFAFGGTGRSIIFDAQSADANLGMQFGGPKLGKLRKGDILKINLYSTKDIDLSKDGLESAEYITGGTFGYQLFGATKIPAGKWAEVYMNVTAESTALPWFALELKGFGAGKVFIDNFEILKELPDGKAFKDIYNCYVKVEGEAEKLPGEKKEPEGPAKVTNLRISKIDTPVKVGDKVQLKVSVLPQDAENKQYSFSVNKPALCTIDDKGILTAKEAGDVNITVTAKDGSSAKHTLKLTIESNSDMALWIVIGAIVLVAVGGTTMLIVQKKGKKSKSAQDNE